MISETGPIRVESRTVSLVPMPSMTASGQAMVTVRDARFRRTSMPSRRGRDNPLHGVVAVRMSGLMRPAIVGRPPEDLSRVLRVKVVDQSAPGPAALSGRFETHGGRVAGVKSKLPAVAASLETIAFFSCRCAYPPFSKQRGNKSSTLAGTNVGPCFFRPLSAGRRNLRA